MTPFPKVRLLAIVAAAAMFGGCANPVEQHYQGMTDVRSKPTYDASVAGLQVYTTDDFQRDRLQLARRGYFPIGHSSFNAAASTVNETQVREHAAAIGAHIVLVSSRYTHTVSGATPMPIPTRSTAYSTGVATATGAGGVVTAYGSGTTTTYGQQTVMVPYSVQRADFGVLFFAKAKTRVGLSVVPLDDETRRRLQSNSGVKVEAVVDKSPAFAADILPGDVVLAIAGQTVTPDSFSELQKAYEGQTVTFALDRDGQRLEKEVSIQPLR